MKTYEKVLLSLAICFTVFVSIIYFNHPNDVKGSVMQGGEYHSTTTSTGAPLFALPVPDTIVPNSGTLGSVIITGSATGAITLYDATTTNANLRASSQSTSTITIASFPPSPTVGTYVFDVAFYRGLIYDVTGTGTQSTTTITYRSNQ